MSFFSKIKEQFTQEKIKERSEKLGESIGKGIVNVGRGVKYGAKKIGEWREHQQVKMKENRKREMERLGQENTLLKLRAKNEKLKQNIRQSRGDTRRDFFDPFN